MPQIEDKQTKVLHPKLSYKICGLCFNIQNSLGRYRNEKQYADAFEYKLKENNIDYKREYALNISFNGEKEKRNVPDFIIENKVVVDFKAKRIITKEDYFQMKRYLASSSLELGLIINFRSKYINSKRVLNNIN